MPRERHTRSGWAAWTTGATGTSWVAWGRRLAVAVSAVTVAYLGGVSATSLAPTTARTQHYRAELRLSPLPQQTSTIHSPTSLGDIDLEFTSLLPAPGMDVTIQTRANITDLFNERGVSVRSLQPSQRELTDALTGAAWRMARTFSLGALAAAAISLALIAVGRRRRPRARHFAVLGLSALIAVLGTGVAVWDSYQPGKLSHFRTTGLLGTLRRNAGLLAHVESRAQQVTPYVTNLLALSQALQDKFVPPNVNEPAAARFLLVSDIHGANAYPFMATIIKDEHITAVIDSGDLLNLGSVTEAEAAGIFRSIAGLGVPYLFARGNHDASGSRDTSLRRRLARIPNVVLLQPNTSSYVQASVAGVTVSGFDDPRYFGDDSEQTAAKQRPAIDAYNRSYAGRPRPDIVVSHEPAAVQGVTEAGLLVNGHLHKEELDGNRIGVGTFTGGGILGHLVPGGTDGEMVDQPYAFDIAVFGERCDLTSLTRYSYRNLIGGRPAYDDVTVINGATIAGEAPPGRTCSPELGPTATSFPAVPPPAPSPQSTTPASPSASLQPNAPATSASTSTP